MQAKDAPNSVLQPSKQLFQAYAMCVTRKASDGCGVGSGVGTRIGTVGAGVGSPVDDGVSSLVGAGVGSMRAA